MNKQRYHQIGLNVSKLWKYIVPCDVRKKRLFAVACCNQLRAFLPDVMKNAVDMTESYADGMCNTQEILKAYDCSRQYQYAMSTHLRSAINDCLILSGDYLQMIQYINQYVVTNYSKKPLVSFAIKKYQCNIFRDIFPHPSITLPPVPYVPYADVIYQDKLFNELPMLADHLLDIGITHTELLNHLKDKTIPHVRGCWALDLLRKGTK